VQSDGGIRTDSGKPKNSEKNMLATSFTTSPDSSCLGLNPDHALRSHGLATRASALLSGVLNQTNIIVSRLF
jgi:hypothetical protein